MRCTGWDYRKPWIYMITLVLRDRSKPLFGNVVIDKFSDSPEEIQAHLSPSALGTSIFKCWQELPVYHPEVRPLYLQLMEEHLHFIIQIKQRLVKPLGNIIGGFKGDCTKLYRSLFNTEDSLFEQGFQDTILMHNDQLKRMFAYLKDNPRRLAVKRLFPELFHINHSIPFPPGHLCGVGNHFLLDAPRFHQIQISNSMALDSATFKQAQDALWNAYYGGAVAVSPCISKGEKELAHTAFEEKMPLIVLRNNLFPKLYKPTGKYFDACANGRLLMIAPPGFGYIPGHRELTRNQACVLNTIAQRICKDDAKPIVYHRKIPDNLELLVNQSLQTN